MLELRALSKKVARNPSWEATVAQQAAGTPGSEAVSISRDPATLELGGLSKNQEANLDRVCLQWDPATIRGNMKRPKH